MPYHIDEENSELAFEVREGNKLVIKIKSNIFSDSLELYLIKVGDNTEPTDKNVFSSLRVLKEIENLHDTILKEINSVTSGFWELKQDSQGNEYISTKYNVLTEGGLTTYGLGEQKLGTIYDGLPIDNDTIYWEEVEGSRVLKAKGSGGGSTGLDETKLWNVLGTPGDQQIDYSHLRSAFSQFSNDFVTINTEQEITALKHFTAGLSVGESKKKIYEENGVVYIDADVAVTGAMTFYASAGRSVSTIMDGVTVDEETITKGSDNVLRIKNAGAGSSFDENAMWSALSGSSDNQINKSHLTTALDGYATQNWVIENYATKSELSAVSNKLNDFLDGSDTDTIINKWKELEAFLSGMVETDNLAEILETKADKKYVDSTFVTLATKQTITGEKTFSSVLNTAAIKASGAITAPSLAASDWVTIAGIKLRKLEDGALMLEGNLALTGALTMYASNGQSFDTIYDGLPIDNDTIYWQEVDGSRVLKAREGGGSSFDKSAMWTALAGSTTEQINKSHLTTALTGYATESWVSGKNYAVKATTLAGYGITDGINAVSVTGTGNAVTAASISGHTLTLTKGSTFSLSGHKHAWSDITSGKPSTLSGYGITDAYTKTESDSKYPTKTGSGASGTWGINISGNASNADKLDGTHKRSGSTYWGVIPFVATDGTFEIGKYLDFHVTSSDTKDYSTRVQAQGAYNNIVNLPTANGNIALTSDNVASASKLQTARTLWGRSFDGTGNVSGNLDNVGKISANGEIITSSANSFRASYGGYGFFIRNDGVSTYFMHTNKDDPYGEWNNNRPITIDNASGRISINSALDVGSVTTFYNKVTGTSISCSDWHRSTGQTGWVNDSYGGGIYMTDATWVRVWNGKGFLCENTIESSYRLSARQLVNVYGALGYGWGSGQAAFQVAIPTNENQTPILLAYNGVNGNQTGNDRYFAIEVLNTGLRNVSFNVSGKETVRMRANYFEVNGDILATGGTTFYGSDIRYKSIIHPVMLLALNKIAEAPSFVYRWNRPNMNQNRLNLGGSAQYTQSVLPWAVEDNDNFLSMDYATVAYTFAVHTARHLLTYESRTDKKIKKLEREIVILKKQLKKLGYEEVRTLDDSGI